MLELFFENAWRWKCGLPEKEPVKLPPLEDLKASEWNDDFEMYMRNRLIMGAIRYGRINQPGKPKYGRVASMIKRLKQYDTTGNKEVLVDVANLCLLEFVECNHPNQHFHAVDENEHVKEL